MVMSNDKSLITLEYIKNAMASPMVSIGKSMMINQNQTVHANLLPMLQYDLQVDIVCCNKIIVCANQTGLFT